MLQLQHVFEALDSLAPWDLAESWDRVGLQVGRYHQPAAKVLVALDINHQIIEEAITQNVNGLVVHHPLIFKPLTQINLNTPTGRCLEALIKNDLFLMATHTNMDKAERGLNQFLAEQFELTAIEPLEPATQSFYKVVVFTPADSLPQIRTAMAQAGAGVIGEYTNCSFGQQGIGTFTPSFKAQPFIGKQEEFTEVTEIRLEMLTPEHNLSKVMKTILTNHPYDEPAIDVYSVVGSSKHGLGRIGNLKTPIAFQDLCLAVKEKLLAIGIRLVGEPTKTIKRLAICSGSGGSLVSTVIKSKADAYLTGEMGYHDFLEAKENGLAVIAAGHWATEHSFIDLVSGYLEDYFKTDGGFRAIPSSTIQEEPYQNLL